jgi:hypothetical protein
MSTDCNWGQIARDMPRRPLHLKLVDCASEQLVDLSALPADRIWLLQGWPAAGYCAQVKGDDTRPFQRTTFHQSAQAAVDELALLAASGATVAAARGITQSEDEPDDEDGVTAADRTVRAALRLTALALLAAALFWHFGG